MDGSRKWKWCPGPQACAQLAVAVLAVWPLHARAMDAAVELAQPRVGVVSARSALADGSSLEETGNCLLWTDGAKMYTLGDLHTVMAGEEEASEHVADEIMVKVGKRSLRARLVWPREGQGDVTQVDIAILELDGGIVGQPFRPEAFQGAAGGLPRELYLAAPGHRSKVVPVAAPAVEYGSEWFIYQELAHGDSGGMVFALENGQVVPYGFVSAIGSLPGESARGTVIYGRHAMRIFVDQFLRARARM